MPTRLILAPVGAGKTEAVLQALTNLLDERPLARAWVLLASRRQEVDFRQRLVAYQDGHQTYFNVEFFNFYDLYSTILNMAGYPARTITASTRYGLLRAVIQQQHGTGTLELFRDIAQTPGFVRVVAELIDELKQNRVEPSDYATAAQTAKDRELATIYNAYQDALQTEDDEFADQEGEGWLALRTLQINNSYWPLEKELPIAASVELLIVDGYDQFTPVQARILGELAQQVGDIMITLTSIPDRVATVGRRFDAARQMLIDYIPDLIVETRTAMPERQVDLVALIEHVFTPHEGVHSADPNQPGVILLEAPDAAQEVATVLRRVKRLLVDGCPPDAIMVALRDWPRYQPHFMAYGRAFGLPLALHYGEKLTDNPAVATLLRLLTLHEADFPQRIMLDLLRSPYIRTPELEPAAVDLLEQISLQYHVVDSKQDWLAAIRDAGQVRQDEDDTYDDDDRIQRKTGLIASEAAEALELALSNFIDYLTPPDHNTTEGYVRWIDDLIGIDPMQKIDDDDGFVEPLYTLDMLAMVRDGGEAVVSRDLSALFEVKRVLRGMLNTEDILASVMPDHSPQQDWQTFFFQMAATLDNTQINPRPNRDGQVLVTTATDARGLPHEHVFILGLSEGLFPAQVSEDALYLDSERSDLTQRGVLLQTRAERATDDGLFYELICLPRQSLTLSRPTTDDGQPWVASHLWRATQRVFASLPVMQVRSGTVVNAESAASLDEAILAIADAFNAPEPDRTSGAGYNWFVAGGDDTTTAYWSRVTTRQMIEARRLSRAPHDAHTGRLSDATLIDHARRQLGDDHRWSASQFNEYGTCPYRFFARRLLKLEALTEPEIGFDHLQRGTLIHEILQQTYGALIGTVVSPKNVGDAEAALHDAAHNILTTAPERYGFRPSRVWQQEQDAIINDLLTFVLLDFSPDNPIRKAFGEVERTIYAVEQPFGRDGGPAVALELDGLDPLPLNGYIDRIDRLDDQYVVLDYKSGSTPYKIDDMTSGREFQMVVYLRALQAVVGAGQVLGGAFWHLSSAKLSGAVGGTGSSNVTVTLQQAEEHLARHVERMRQGDFAVEPTKPDGSQCVRYCDYRGLCRLCGLGIAKRMDDRE